MSCPRCAECAWQVMGDAELVAAAARVAGLEAMEAFDPLHDDAHCMLLVARFAGLGVDRIVADAWAVNHQADAARRYVRRNVVLAVARIDSMDAAAREARGWW